MAATETPDFVFFTGDVPWDGGDIGVHEKIRSRLANAFGPKVPVYFLLGNHDFNGHTPYGDEVKAWYSTVAKEWGAWLDADAKKSFATYGYYHQSINARTRLVALNTEVFNHGDASVLAGDTIPEALAQLKWLEETLAACAAKNETAFVFGHVPPGMETGYLNDATEDASLRLNWMPLWVSMFAAVVDEYAATVKLQSFGHEHTDTFRLLGEKGVAFSVPSLSTGYPRTNPTTRLWKYDRAAGAPTDWDQYYMDLLASNAARTPKFHRAYSAAATYGLADLSRASVEKVLAGFEANRTGVYAAERRFFWSSTPETVMPACDAACQTVDLCDKRWAAREANLGGFDACLYAAL